MKAAGLEYITKQTERLTLSEQIELIEILVRRIKQHTRMMTQKLDWQELYGLGKGVWKDEDAQEYVNRLREERI